MDFGPANEKVSKVRTDTCPLARLPKDDVGGGEHTVRLVQNGFTKMEKWEII